ncbi:TetR family transcriptional regulator [Nocardia sp. CDC159]|uniref:TetR family transcriptional regulator n=1 Tax=Nocardia pulmonis TaxID=2951408 RepID=A0A9X2EFE9_9NOCA|nr:MULTISPECIES: TetR family transcriptional regulator [Nocardia]MCM6777963.1 TetR family transcriptional regulator [Nocardia pulmonis]MCM6790866.1 TetR family transcriptional regulator [Nocardia sp. CDC159]
MPGETRVTAGLRERKKERTRRTIRTEAMRLFKRQGYAETTIEQIAEAADISPSTFFRYFPSKQDVVLADDLDPIMVEAIRSQPPEMPPLTVFRNAFQNTIAALDDEEVRFEQERMTLIWNEPELRGVIARETERNVQMVAGLVAERVGRAPDDLEVRAFSGALIGAAMTAWGPDGLDFDKVDRIVDFLAAGMPLPSAPKTDESSPR